MSVSQVQWMFDDAGLAGKWSFLARSDPLRWSGKMDLKQTLESLRAMEDKHAERPVRFYITRQHEADPETLILDNKEKAIATFERMMDEDAPSDRVSRLCQQEPVEETKAGDVPPARVSTPRENELPRGVRRRQNATVEETKAADVPPARVSSLCQNAPVEETKAEDAPPDPVSRLCQNEVVEEAKAEDAPVEETPAQVSRHCENELVEEMNAEDDPPARVSSLCPNEPAEETKAEDAPPAQVARRGQNAPVEKTKARRRP